MKQPLQTMPDYSGDFLDKLREHAKKVQASARIRQLASSLKA